MRRETMKTMILAAAVVLTFGANAAYAGDGEGPIPNTQFTESPQVIAQAPGYYTNRAYAATQNSGTSLFVTEQHPVSTNPGVGG